MSDRAVAREPQGLHGVRSLRARHHSVTDYGRFGPLQVVWRADGWRRFTLTGGAGELIVRDDRVTLVRDGVVLVADQPGDAGVAGRAEQDLTPVAPDWHELAADCTGADVLARIERHLEPVEQFWGAADDEHPDFEVVDGAQPDGDVGWFAYDRANRPALYRREPWTRGVESVVAEEWAGRPCWTLRMRDGLEWSLDRALGITLRLSEPGRTRFLSDVRVDESPDDGAFALPSAKPAARAGHVRVIVGEEHGDATTIHRGRGHGPRTSSLGP